jgi:hypothetical protein
MLWLNYPLGLGPLINELEEEPMMVVTIKIKPFVLGWDGFYRKPDGWVTVAFL